MIALLLFISALLILAAAIYNAVREHKANVPLILSALVYTVFCFVVSGKLTGFIPCMTIGEIVQQGGFDLRRLPIPIDVMINYACLLTSVFNILTAVWIYLRLGFWKWLIYSVIGFCLICGAAGPFYGFNPIISLFGGCCGFMLLVGWGLGLTYIEFCVIGNIWVPLAALVISACIMAYMVLRNKNAGVLTKGFAGGICLIECMTSAAVGIHYALPYREAFYLCVEDLRAIARIFHTTYEVVNIAIYVVGIVNLLIINILLARRYRRI